VYNLETALAEIKVLQAQLAAAQQPSVPEGWKLVPVVPTSEMTAFENTGVHWNLAERIYNAVLAAAPQPKDMK
jgi:hypothetical protein